MFDDWREPKRRRLVEHKLLYHGSFSEFKLKFAILKGTVQFRLRKNLGARLYGLLGEPFESLTDCFSNLEPCDLQFLKHFSYACDWFSLRIAHELFCWWIFKIGGDP